MALKVSVVVPIFNAEKYLYQCLETILGQTLKDIEVILIDNFSMDRSYQICEEFKKQDSRIRLYSRRERSFGSNCNFGIQLAKGEYLLFINPSDFLERDTFQVLYRRAKLTNSDIVLCDYWNFDDVTKNDSEICCGIRADAITQKKVFSALECSENIFQMIEENTALVSLYKKSFILKNNLKFCKKNGGEKLVFNRSALVIADKISTVGRGLLHHRINISESFPTNKNAFSIFDAYIEFYNFLVQRKLYQFYKKSFLEWIVTSILSYDIEKLKYPFRFFAEYYFANNIVSRFKLDNLPKNYFNSKGIHDKIKKCIYSSSRSLELINWYNTNNNGIVPIVLTTDEEDSLICEVALQSIIENVSNHRFYDIYVLYSNLSEPIRNQLENSTKSNVHITTVCIKEFFNDKNFCYWSGIPYPAKTFHYHFIISSILSYKKILYLDSNLIVQKDISELYDTELGNNLVAGVADILSNEDEKERINWGLEPLEHINAGVLLINNKLWLDEGIQGKCFGEVVKPSYSWGLKDQDIINFVCQDRILLLNPKWNFLYKAFHWEKDKYESYVNSFNLEEYAIIHYNGTIKPWNSSENECSNFWWKYARISPSYEIILSRFVRKSIKEENVKPKLPPVVSCKPPKIENDEESIYKLKCAFLTKLLGYLFSLGKKRKMYKMELDLIMKKLGEVL